MSDKFYGLKLSNNVSVGTKYELKWAIVQLVWKLAPTQWAIKNVPLNICQ